jgi:type III secretion protein L
VSKKFFSFLHGGKVNIAPKTKILPGEVVSTLFDALEVQKQMQVDAEQYKKEVAAECEKIKEQARKDGFEEGFAQWVAKIADLEEEIQRVRKDTEKMVVPIAVQSAKKIVGRELETSESTITDIIINSLRSVAQHKKVTIYVSRKQFDAVEKDRERIKSVFENLEVLSIAPQDNIPDTDCIIETEKGIINAQLENKWLILENALKKQLKQPTPEQKKEEKK